MRTLLGLTLSLALVLAACSQDWPTPTSPAPLPDQSGYLTLSANGDYVSGRLLVRFRAGAPEGTILSGHQARALREILLGIEEIEVPPGLEKTIAAALQRSGWVEFAEPDYVRTFGIPCSTGDCTAPTDTYFDYRWDLHNDGTVPTSSGAGSVNTGHADADIDWLEAFAQLGSFSGSANVAILDTGIDPTHPDLAGRILTHQSFVGGKAKDQDGHGTHVAGIIAGIGNNGTGVSGVAWGPNIKLIIGKVCAQNGCPVSAIVDGISWAVDNGANVINLSLGGPTGTSTEQAALQYARAHNVLPFCAAGNESGPVSYPAAFPECVAVSATDWNDDLASYSNFGPQVELAAPGGDDESFPVSYILSTWATGVTPCTGSTPCYVWIAGTSMATPEAAGLAALLHALGITDDDTKLQRMKETADDLGTPGTDNQFGAGRINVFAAINGGSPPPVPQCSNGIDDDSDGKTDYPADPGCSSLSDDSESPDPPPASITLTATAESKGAKRRANLHWSGASGTSVQVRRNDALVKTTGNDGQYYDNLPNGSSGTFTYQVCESAGSPCSNTAQATF